MTADILLSSILPPQTFLSFEAVRIAKPVLAWVRDAECLEFYLSQYSYCVPLSHESRELYINDQVTVFAERYGGDGIGTNGGGARCGNLDGLQIKGIGPTDLAGVGEDYWHSYGGATLKEALREAIWGEVFNSTLPFGAITIEAIIIVSGSEVELPYPSTDGKTHCPRALMIRPQFARPAHYFRAPLFRASAQFKLNQPTDTERTKAAIQRLHEGLTYVLASVVGGRPIVDLLTEMYERFAIQIAAARAKRLLHGSLSASNIALDGRFLDFGMSSSVSDYGRISIARDCPDAWLQQRDLVKAITDFTFFVYKYGDGILNPTETSAQILNAFQRKLDERFAIEILKLTGIPEPVLLEIPESDLSRIVEPFLSIIQTGNSEPFKLLAACPNYIPKMPDRMGKYHLSTCIKIAIAADTQEEAETLLVVELPDSKLRHSFIQSIWQLRTFYLAGKEEAASCQALDFLRLNGFRLNTNLPALYSYNLNAAIDAVISSGENLQDFITQMVSEAIQLVQDPCNGTVQLKNPSTQTNLIGTEADGLICNGHTISFVEVSQLFPELFHSAENLS
jgi:hypothetical protein